MASVGGVSEGEKDKAVLEALIPRILPDTDQVLFLVAGNKPQLMKKFSGLLRGLEHITIRGGPVDKAIVVRDADNRDFAQLEREMAEKIQGRTYLFPSAVQVHAICQELETWLLADVNAINRVAQERSGRSVRRAIPRPLEVIMQPSILFQDVLSEARLNYTAEVCGRIAAELSLDTLRTECPSFVRFETKILDP